jgi:hypothetical protein
LIFLTAAITLITIVLPKIAIMNGLIPFGFFVQRKQSLTKIITDMTKTHLVLCMVLTLFLAACGLPKNTQSTSTGVQRIPAKFDYSPPSRAQVGSTGLILALIKPRFVDKGAIAPQYLAPPFNDMAVSMGNDFEELLSAKGFTMRGPFGSRDEMVYNDKQNSSFALEINIDLNGSQYNQKYKYYPGIGSLVLPTYRMTGDVILGGDLIITASSPQYGEKIWKKNIRLETISFKYEGSIKWNNMPSIADELRKDNVVYNAFARELEKYYQQAMNLAWQQIDPAEMKMVADQAKKADKKGS